MLTIKLHTKPFNREYGWIDIKLNGIRQPLVEDEAIVELGSLLALFICVLDAHNINENKPITSSVDEYFVYSK